MVLEFGGAVDEYFVEMLREEGLRTQEEETDEGDGMTGQCWVTPPALAVVVRSSQFLINPAL